jgi:hypothetical protein
MRGLYLLNFALLGSDVWPAIFHRAGSWDPTKGAAYSLWAALSLLSGLGLRYPLQVLPLLLFQFVYKAVWLLAVARPQWSTLSSADITQAMLIGIVLDLVVIPWPYVFANYVTKRGERWGRSA